MIDGIPEIPPVEALRLRSNLFAVLGYVATCKKQNTDEWMSRLVERINESLELLGDSTRLEYHNGSIVCDPAVRS